MKKKSDYDIPIYTVIFVVLMGLILWFFQSQGKSLVYRGDGWRQHLRALTYYGKYLRGALRHLIFDHSLTPQTWGGDFGYGADILTTLQYYCFGDPLAALSVFVPTKYSAYLYEALIVIRPWLAGVAFLLYARTRRVTNLPAKITGAVVYAFSGTVLYIGFLHPFFVIPLVCFPLMLAGMEIIFLKSDGVPLRADRRLVPFTLAVAVAALSNFYFFYMLAILTAAYGVARLFQRHILYGARGGALVSVVFREGLRVFGAACIGTLIAAVILAPVVVQYVEDPRAEMEFARLRFYSPSYYLELPKNLVSWVNHPDGDTELCFALTFLPLLLILLIRRGHRTLKICLALIILMLLLPAAGVAMNGFSYTINRWTWGVAMLAGWICVRATEDLATLRKAQSEDEASDETRKSAASGGVRRVLVALIPVLTVASVVWNITDAFSEARHAFPQEFMDRTDADGWYTLMTDNETMAVAEAGGVSDQDFYRYSGRNLNWNAALGSGLSSTQYEYSFANGSVSDFFELIGNNDEQNFAYFALDDRMIASSLAGVRYYTLAYDNYYEYRFVPYGFVDQGMIGTYHVYENPNAMPLGFATNRVMAQTEAETLPLPLREEALLTAAIVDGPGGALPANLAGAPYEMIYADNIRNTSATQELPYEVICGDGVQLTDEGFVVSSYGAVATLNCAGASESEFMLSFDGLYVDGDDYLYDITLCAQQNGEEIVTKILPYKTPKLQYYSDWHDFIINFGTACADADAITLTFPSPGTYRFDAMRLWARPMAGIPEKLQTLASTPMTDIDLHRNPVSRATNRITGTVAPAVDALLILNLPYTRGWSAYVDGARVQVYHTDALFCSIAVSPGTHNIELKYHTPGLAAGAIMSLLGIALLVLIARQEKSEEKNKN